MSSYGYLFGWNPTNSWPSTCILVAITNLAIGEARRHYTNSPIVFRAISNDLRVDGARNAVVELSI